MILTITNYVILYSMCLSQWWHQHPTKLHPLSWILTNRLFYSGACQTNPLFMPYSCFHTMKPYHEPQRKVDINAHIRLFALKVRGLSFTIWRTHHREIPPKRPVDQRSGLLLLLCNISHSIETCFILTVYFSFSQKHNPLHKWTE